MFMRSIVLALFVCAGARAADEMTLYELLPPESHQFAITYDVTATRPNARIYLNPIRPGSTASKERVIERSTGTELAFSTISGKEAKGAGLLPATVADESQYLRVQLPRPVPHNGETRIRIFKTYTDAKSYHVDEKGNLVFDRPFGIRRNVVVLPSGWELIGCASPCIISTGPDGRIRVSFLNDRDDQLPVKITARRMQ